MLFDNLKPSLQCFQQVFSAFFGRQIFFDYFGQHAAGKDIDGLFEQRSSAFQACAESPLATTNARPAKLSAIRFNLVTTSR